MSTKVSRFFSYLNYWLDAVDRHSLHSPFYFDLNNNVINVEESPLEKIEALRQKLAGDSRTITVQDYGSGSRSKNVRSVAEIVETAVSPPALSLLYRRIIKKFEHRAIIELGTCVGINTLYLADISKVSVTTFEGAPSLADIAEVTFEFAEAKNIELVRGNIDDSLSDHLAGVRKVDFVLMDANHTYAATMRYFRLLVAKLHAKSVVVIDDIHHSAGMEKAWKEIIQHELVHGSIDLFRCGILFFDPSLTKQHVILQAKGLN